MYLLNCNKLCYITLNLCKKQQLYEKKENIMRFVRKLFIFILFCFVFYAFEYSAKAATLSKIRLGKQDDKTVRVVAHIDEKNPCRIFTLENPARVVLDFENTALDKKCVQNVPSSTGFVQSTRLGEPIANKTRVVLETTAVPSFSDGFYLAPPVGKKEWRYVLDLKLAENKVKLPVATSERLMPIAASAKTTFAQNTQISQKKLTKPLIVLDPGHGGSDPGAISQTGRYEKNLTLQMAKEVKAALEKTGKYRVLMTRDTDKALALRQRIRFAHDHKADLFISIHADSAKNKKAKGLSVYTISEKASDKEAQLLAERENKADIILGIDLSDQTPEVSNILIDLEKRATMDKSALFANLLVDKMASNITLVPNAHRFAGFVVLKSPSISSVLIEIGYLSNRQEEKLLTTSSYRAKLANSIVQAVHGYFDNIYE